MITHLVLSSGGVKGLAILGALSQLDLTNFRFVVGTSVGSIIGLLLIIGYTPYEILNEMVNKYKCRLQHLQIDGPGFRPYGIGQGVGIFDWNIVEDVLTRMIVAKTGTNFTLLSLYETYGKELVCVTYNYTKHRIEYISMINNPDMPVETACHMSSAIPFIFEDFYWNDELYFDGAIVSQLALECILPRNYPTTVAINLAVTIPPPSSKGSSKEKIYERIYNLLCIRINADSTYKQQALKFEECRGRVITIQTPSLPWSWTFEIETMCELYACGIISYNK